MYVKGVWITGIATLIFAPDLLPAWILAAAGSFLFLKVIGG
jgi:hypothetical protein